MDGSVEAQVDLVALDGTARSHEPGVDELVPSRERRHHCACSAVWVGRSERVSR